MPDVPGFVGAAAGGLLALTMFLIRTHRGDIRELAATYANEGAWRRQLNRTRVVLVVATLLLIGVLIVAVPALIDLIQGDKISAPEWIALAAAVPGFILWPLGAGNVRLAAANLAEVRRRIYGRDG